eukprot:TRINITY_DN16011_c0_g1_i1.p1 TRINITY_DN16011_c0_g1~~TRINITY_DN16011_c0_g1_i1.p1  ORF type:complete len:354 (+),score=59.69 TRINITY_DN16011_c0_g1_i1:209-1270(+)
MMACQVSKLSLDVASPIETCFSCSHASSAGKSTSFPTQKCPASLLSLQSRYRPLCRVNYQMRGCQLTKGLEGRRVSSSLQITQLHVEVRSFIFGPASLIEHCNSGRKQPNRKRGGEGGGPRGVAMASILGVGAPEALVIAVVALLVFGPKGLAEVARNLGKTLRTFQPTIRELQSVSREFRNTLEQEIGLDEIKNPPPYPPSPNTPQAPFASSIPPTLAAPSPPSSSLKPTNQEEGEGAKSERPASASSSAEPANGTLTAKKEAEPRGYTSEELARITEEQMAAVARAREAAEVPQDLRNASEAAAWGGSPPSRQTPSASSDGGASASPSPPASQATPAPSTPPSNSTEKSSP